MKANAIKNIKKTPAFEKKITKRIQNMRARADNKEHHFCFAYMGERMREDLFESMKFANVQGISTADGTQLVRISLQKQNGRRGHTIHKIIEQYNKNAVTDIKPEILFPMQQQALYCFKLNHPAGSNPILIRIEQNKKTPSYWSWNTTSPQEKSAKKRKELLSIIEKTLEEMHVDPSTLPLQRICEEIQAKMEEEEDETAINITEELKRYIGREQMYLVAPPAAATASMHIFDMDDLVFKNTGAQDPPHDDGRPNETIKAYFRKMLPEWGELAHVTAEQVVSALNNKSAGLYKRACVAHFLRPFIKDGSIETKDNVHFTIHTHRVAEKIIK